VWYYALIGMVFLRLDYTTRKSKMNWDDSCKGLVSMLTLNELAYTVQPRPSVGKVDLAGAFLHTDKFIEENVLFSKYSVCTILVVFCLI
jgi:hypothetical protein